MPDDDRVHEQVQFVDQVLLEQPADERCAAGRAESVSCLSSVSAAFMSPLRTLEFSQVGSASALDATYLRALFICAVNG